jgi:hypothetical protein
MDSDVKVLFYRFKERGTLANAYHSTQVKLRSLGGEVMVTVVSHQDDPEGPVLIVGMKKEHEERVLGLIGKIVEAAELVDLPLRIVEHWTRAYRNHLGVMAQRFAVRIHTNGHKEGV